MTPRAKVSPAPQRPWGEAENPLVLSAKWVSRVDRTRIRDIEAGMVRGLPGTSLAKDGFSQVSGAVVIKLIL